jgi:hypothetical protein
VGTVCPPEPGAGGVGVAGAVVVEVDARRVV